MIPHYKKFSAFFDKHKDSDNLTFESFIIEDHAYICTHYNRQNENEFRNWLSYFKRSAKEYNIEVLKGDAHQAWKTYVSVKENKEKTCSKRKYSKACVSEYFENLKGNLTGELKFDDIDMTASFNEYRKNAIEQFANYDKCSEAHNFCNDLNKLFAVQRIILLDHTNHEMKEALGQSFKEFVQKSRLKQYGVPSRLPSSLRQEIEDAFEDCRFDKDYDLLEDKLQCLKRSFSIKKDKAGANVMRSLMLMMPHMTEEKKESTEMRIQSGVIFAVCQIFKFSPSHDAHGYNVVLFPSCSALSGCRPDFVVEVGVNDKVTNVIGEIKSGRSSADGLALDLYRIGVFGLVSLREYKLKTCLVFQTNGSRLTFFLCSVSSGVCLLLDVGKVSLPSTFEEFLNFGSQLNILYDLAKLYQSHCVVDDSSSIEEWGLLDYTVLKEIYDLGHSTVKTSTNAKASSSTEVCL
ncbi:hypothetical protein EDC96DRAFT_525539 [Choanephora cucurbitarum]|nr:hypothetical protein EDC96DRAFT_525539 [Choanephora cucurbitarum]